MDALLLSLAYQKALATQSYYTILIHHCSRGICGHHDISYKAKEIRRSENKEKVHRNKYCPICR